MAKTWVNFAYLQLLEMLIGLSIYSVDQRNLAHLALAMRTMKKSLGFRNHTRRKQKLFFFLVNIWDANWEIIH